MRLSAIADVVVPQVPLCPLPLALIQCRWAVKEFLDRTRAWTDIVTGKWHGDQPECELEYPMDSKASSVHEVRVDGRMVPHLAGEKLIWPVDVVDSNGPRFWRFCNGKLTLYPYNTSLDSELCFNVEAHVVLTISGNNPDLPEWLDIDVIASGAMSKLYEMPGQTWSNPSIATYFEGKFREGVAAKRIERDHGGRSGFLTIKTPRMGGYF